MYDSIQQEINKDIADLVRSKMKSGNEVPVSQCVIRREELLAIERKYADIIDQHNKNLEQLFARDTGA